MACFIQTGPATRNLTPARHRQVWIHWIEHRPRGPFEMPPVANLCAPPRIGELRMMSPFADGRCKAVSRCPGWGRGSAKALTLDIDASTPTLSILLIPNQAWCAYWLVSGGSSAKGLSTVRQRQPPTCRRVGVHRQFDKSTTHPLPPRSARKRGGLKYIHLSICVARILDRQRSGPTATTKLVYLAPSRPLPGDPAIGPASYRFVRK